MSRKVGTWSAFVVVAAVAALGCEGPKGADGAQGIQGPKGDAGAACAVTDNGNGTKTIACTDGTSAIVSDGARGEAGNSCTVATVEGVKTISCTDGTSLTVADGAKGDTGENGADGTSCTVADNQDGTKTVTCGETSVTIANGAKGDTGDKGDKGDTGETGAAGTSCSVTDNQNGTKTIACTDETSVLVSDGAQGIQGIQGEKGDKGDTGANGATGPTGPSAAFVFNLAVEVPQTLALTVTKVDTTAAKVTVSFTVKDFAGRGAVGLRVGSSGGNARFALAKLVAAANGEPSYWEDYVLSTTTGGPTSDRTGVLVDNKDGSYVYTFAADVKNVTTPKAILWEPGLTTRLVVQVSGTGGGIAATAGGISLPYINAIYDFVPDGTPLTETRAVTTTKACNECHGKLTLHGSRVETGYCVLCHAPAEPEIRMDVMVHAIHGAAMRGAAHYTIGTADFSEVTYPAPLNNCLKCHNGADSAQGDNWKKFPTKEACGSCHAAVDFTTHMGGQTDNTGCASSSCHTEARITTAHASENASPHAVAVVAGARVFTYEVKDATMAEDGTHPIITFKITMDGTAMDLTGTTLPTDISGGPSFLLAYALPQDGIDAPADYNNKGVAAAQPLSISLANVRDGTKGTLVADAANAGYYIATLTGTNAFPAGATLRTVALQGYFSQANVPGYTGALGRHTLASVKAVTGDTVRREVIDSAKCGACHEWFEGHGGNRLAGLGTVGPNICTVCHVPNLSTSGRTTPAATAEAALRIGAGAGWDLNRNGACDAATEDKNGDALCDILDQVYAAGYTTTDPLTWPETSNNLKDMLHGIHGAAKRTAPFREVRLRSGGAYYLDFSEVTYPNEKDACLACHKPGTFGSVPEGALTTTFVTSNGTNTQAGITAARSSLPNATDTITTPFAAACSGCHDTTLAVTHMNQNGAYVNAARGDVPTDYVETCVLCHGAGRAEDVNVVHFQ